MKYRIENQNIIIDSSAYGALGDDFSFQDSEAIDYVIKQIEDVLSGYSEVESIYGDVCYRINVSKEKSLIYCYDEFLGEEPSCDIYSMLKDYRSIILNHRLR